MQRTGQVRALLATIKPLFKEPPWLFTVEAGGSAIDWWQAFRPPIVLADFGALDDGMSGVRLAKAIRSRCTQTRLYLLSDAIRPEQVLWARSQGADDVIRRSYDGIARLCSPDAELVRFRRRLIRRVAQRLDQAGALGERAAFIVEEMVSDWEQRYHGALPTVYELTLAVSPHIDDLAARRAFVNGFAQACEARAPLGPMGDAGGAPLRHADAAAWR